jgi:hypothetical protein
MRTHWEPPKKNPNKGCVTLRPCHFTFKKHLKAKEEELWKLKYFTMQKYINLQKKTPVRETKILQDIIKLYNN